MNEFIKLGALVALITGWFTLTPPRRTQQAPSASPIQQAQAISAMSSSDVGVVAKPGSMIIGQSNVVLAGSGTGVQGQQDGFHFVSQPWTGDGQFIVKISGVQSPGGLGTAGLMVRNSLDANAPFVSVGLMAKGKVIVQRRIQAGSNSESQVFGAIPQGRRVTSVSSPIGSVTNINPSSTPATLTVNATQDTAAAPISASATLNSKVVSGVTAVGSASWLKLERHGNSFTAYFSPDGVSWSWVGTEQITMGNTVYVGLAATSSETANELTANFEQLQLTAPAQGVAAPSTPVGTGNGLLASYEGKLTGAHLQRIDTTVDFQWGMGAPSPEIGKDMFDVRWEGMLEPQFSETYALQVNARDGFRLWVDDRLVINLWNEQGGNPITEIALTAGKRVHIRLDYFANYGEAHAQLLWSSPSTPRQVIPQTQLYSQVVGQPLVSSAGDGIPDLWKLAYGLNTNDPNAALATNADGLTYLQKYLTGQDPTQLAAVPTPLQSGWSSQDIGDVGTPGTVQQTGNSFKVGGSGDNIQYYRDGFQFVYQSWTGDVQIIARVDSLDNSDPWTKAGVMVRADLTDRAANALIALTPARGPTAQERTEYSGFTDWRGWADKSHYKWIKLVRRGNSVASFASPDGVVWEWLHNRQISLGTNVYVGLAVSSANNAKFATAQFSQVQVSAAPPLQHQDASAGLGDGLLGTYTDGTGAMLQRFDTNVAFDWGPASPMSGIGSNNFDVRWEGILEAPYTEACQLILEVKDRARLWVDGQMIVDLWGNDLPEGAPRKYRGQPFALRAGHRYAIKLEYHENTDRALAMLKWKSPSIAEQPIPQRYLYSPQNKFFNQALDSDGDGIPDAWMMAYFGHPTGLASDNSRAQDDADGDGLTNLQEYQAGTDPTKPDSNGDGIPDAWAVKYGFEAGGEPIANQTAEDGLTMLQEYQRGLDPTRVDVDLSPGDVQSVQTVAQVQGSAVAAELGNWVVDQNVIYDLSRRGYVEYDLVAPQPDVYRLEVAGGPHGLVLDGIHQEADITFAFPLILSVDGVYLDSKTLTNWGTVNTLTPWLPAGTHRLRIYWDNVSKFAPPLQISSVNLVALKGIDADRNGVSDWVDARLKVLNGFDTGTQGVVSSFVSPFCLEGHAHYVPLMQLQAASNTIPVQSGAGSRWFANVPLVLYDSVQVDATFENAGSKQSVAVRWMPLDLASTNQIIIRSGDSLWFTVEGVGSTETLNTFDLNVAGVTNFSGQSKPVVVRFDQPGTFTVNGTCRPSGNSHTLTVTVLGWAFGDSPAAWAGKSRNWVIPLLPTGSTTESGIETTLEDLTSPGDTNTTYSLETERAASGHVVARSGTNGAIYATTEIKGFRLSSGDQTGLQVTKVFDDGSHMVEMEIVMSPIRPEIRVEVLSFVSGVVFDDGTIEKELTAADFNELGVAVVRFVKPNSVSTSTCHILRAYQGNTLLGTH